MSCPSTQYDDYLINEEYFHWQFQKSDAHSNKGSRRYMEQIQKNIKIILFVRTEKYDGFGNTMSFHCFGLVDYGLIRWRFTDEHNMTSREAN